MTPIKIYPSIEECKIKNVVKCTEEGCKAIFLCESNLRMHVTKTHGKSDPTNPDIIKHFYCPDTNCAYHERRHMKSMKDLRQHYLKVHADKDFVCIYCSKVFSSLGILKRHIDFCGVFFNCCECKVKYDSYETLRTHCRRKNHHIHEKKEYKKNYKEQIAVSDPNILSKYHSQICESVCDISTRNNIKRNSKMTQVQRAIVVVPQFTKFTQTGPTASVETQTIGDCPAVVPLTKKNSDTQTDLVELKSRGSNTTFYEDSSQVFELKEKNSSSTQTNYESQNIFNANCSSIHTDTSDLIMSEDTIPNLDPFLNCNTETQTDCEIISFGDILNGFNLTDNQTQTVFDPIDISSDKCDLFGLTDNETQTMFDDLLRSVESQTMMSHVKKNSDSYMNMITMQTQTEEYREMLEIINS